MLSRLIVTQPRGIMARVARIVFTQQLRRFTETPEVDAPASTVRQAIAATGVK